MTRSADIRVSAFCVSFGGMRRMSIIAMQWGESVARSLTLSVPVISS